MRYRALAHLVSLKKTHFLILNHWAYVLQRHLPQVPGLPDPRIEGGEGAVGWDTKVGVSPCPVCRDKSMQGQGGEWWQIYHSIYTHCSQQGK